MKAKAINQITPDADEWILCTCMLCGYRLFGIPATDICPGCQAVTEYDIVRNAQLDARYVALRLALPT